MDKKTIGISALITLGLIAASMIGPTFFENPQYYCEDKGIMMQCPGGLSGGQMTRCYLNQEQNSWNFCRSGWLEITNDLEIQEDEEEEEEEEEIEIPSNPGQGIQYRCDSEKCVRIK